MAPAPTGPPNDTWQDLVMNDTWIDDPRRHRWMEISGQGTTAGGV